MPIDPICKMKVAPEEAIAIAFEGETIYFCSEGCRNIC